MAGPLLSTVNVALGPAAGAVLPAVSVAVAAAMEIPRGPLPVMLESVTVRVVPVPDTPTDAAVLPPLTENCGAGASAIASLNVAVSVNVVPCLTGPDGAYVMAAVGRVFSMVKVAPLVGVELTTLPAMSVPMLIVTVAVPAPACT